MGVKVIRIYQLDSIINARLEMVGGFFEVEVPLGPVAGGFQNKRLSFEQLAELLAPHAALTLAAAQALVTANPPAVVPGCLYGSTGDWNATGTDTTVYVQGVRPDAYHTLGVVYDDQGVGQLVEVDVVAGTYKALAGDLLLKDNVFTGANTFEKSVTVLDLLVTSVQNVALNTFSKVVAWIENAAARLGATSATDPAAPQSALAVAGLGLRKVGNVLGLLPSASQLPLGPGVVGLIADDTGQLMSNSFANGYLASGFLEVQAGASISFKGNQTPQFCVFFDQNKAYLRAVSLYQDPYLGVVPPGAAYIRLSYPKADYPTQWYSLGRLPYMRGVQTKNGPLYPDGQGFVDIANYSGNGTSYTDAQARAAQLGRTAAAGTTTVTLTAESPIDYGTFSSGTPTIDATDCVAGKGARFVVGAGAQAPAFLNAPSGQSYKYLGATYATGQPFSYSLYVCADRIEVVILAE